MEGIHRSGSLDYVTFPARYRSSIATFSRNKRCSGSSLSFLIFPRDFDSLSEPARVTPFFRDGTSYRAACNNLPYSVSFAKNYSEAETDSSISTSSSFTSSQPAYSSWAVPGTLQTSSTCGIFLVMTCCPILSTLKLSAGTVNCN